MAEFDAEDWYQRLKAAGGKMRVDDAQILPSPNAPSSPEIDRVLDEVRGEENRSNYQKAYGFMRAMAGPITGWADL